MVLAPLFEQLCSLQNLTSAYWKARKRKACNADVQHFHQAWKLHLIQLKQELLTKSYHPQPLKTFVLRDPKTRTICVSDFRDRVVHHALVNVLQPIFEPRFIYDSYASRKGKGTLAALRRLTSFLRKVTSNGKLVAGAKNANAVCGFALKADIRHYFETVDHSVLLHIIRKMVNDDDILWLVRTILDNYCRGQHGKGMPLGNWTSQFFANVYLNELDHFVKHQLKVKYYIRYVDDFVILSRSKKKLEADLQHIAAFLSTLCLQLHPGKSRILPLSKGIPFLGFKVFYHCKRVRRNNIRSMEQRLRYLLNACREEEMDYQCLLDVLQGWNAYAMHGNSYHLRQRIVSWVRDALQNHKSFIDHCLL
ncbi:group II intron reverse transcriptase domain-containing protein [Candidatus Woesearchaeota archaeon]|nr:group II intron reverse transcriptase domain-containing protein [Candidatus Woesearchaeota archaeon]